MILSLFYDGLCQVVVETESKYEPDLLSTSLPMPWLATCGHATARVLKATVVPLKPPSKPNPLSDELVRSKIVVIVISRCNTSLCCLALI